MIIYKTLVLKFSFEPWYYGIIANAAIDETENQPGAALIVEAPEFFIMSVTDELVLHHIFECSVCVFHFSIYGLFVSPCSFNSNV